MIVKTLPNVRLPAFAVSGWIDQKAQSPLGVTLTMYVALPEAIL